jgi:hypothetical protein
VIVTGYLVPSSFLQVCGRCCWPWLCLSRLYSSIAQLLHEASLYAFVAISQATSFFSNMNPVPRVQYSSLVHNVLVKHTSWDPAFADLFLKAGNFCQSLSVPNELLNPGLLFVVQLDV